MEAVGASGLWVVKKYLYRVVGVFILGILLGSIVLIYVLPQMLELVKLCSHLIVIKIGGSALISMFVVVMFAALMPVTKILRM